jgi:hypothetical protein
MEDFRFFGAGQDGRFKTSFSPKNGKAEKTPGWRFFERSSMGVHTRATRLRR